MAAKPDKVEGAEGEPKPKGKKGKLIILLAIPLVLGGVGAGLWFTGILPGLLGMGPAAEADAGHGGDGHAAADAHAAAAPAGGHGAPAPAAGHGAPAGGHGAPAAAAPPVMPAGVRAPIYFDMPDIVANLNAPGRRATYIKLRSKLEIGKAEDAAMLQVALPRLLDLFTTYLREMRPEELRGSAGTQRLREELIARASIAAAPARVTDVLFVELLLQ